jgi:dTDP-4-dehydrorhamnose 3,5-epimerase
MLPGRSGTTDVVRFTETPLSGAFLIEPELHEDERGFFARTYCEREFDGFGLEPVAAQASVSMNYRKGTLRGMHFQVAPAEEAKLVRCTGGAIHDVIVDLRPSSDTYLSYYAVELSATNRLELYVPKRFAHGFQTLTEHAEVAYQISQFYSPGHSAGLAHDDPALGIDWPLPVSVISESDRSWARLQAKTTVGK